jgi:hypothetical protein
MEKKLLINSIIFLIGLFYSFTFGASDGTFVDTPIDAIDVFGPDNYYYINYTAAALLYTTQNGYPNFEIWLRRDSSGVYKNLLATLLQAKAMGANVNIMYHENGGGYTLTGVTIYQK